jgi:hypothetical protein
MDRRVRGEAHRDGARCVPLTSRGERMMQRPKLALAAALMAGLLAGGTIFADPIAGAVSEAKDVFVNNDAAHPVPVAGTVNAVPAAPATAFSDDIFGVSTGVPGTRIHGPDPGGTRYAISSLTLSNDSSDAQYVQLALGYTSTGASPCSGAQFLPAIELAPLQTTQLTFPQPFITRPPTSGDPSQPVCLGIRASGPANFASSVNVYIVGHTV